ncbi:ribonuclease P protein component [Aequorivita sublithincola DSM 14238]|uniref:Ribonuclease P protein component n=1 Tax=Aequorivita sublithincola (strain DSM 14238 / LMG 21431 / ACAM 643 / 9-3) TaxID=746697 RepID=I3YUS4_AEQSU|nr:ribonuclease P protein component [Aequorivita sublithincola]AFL80742.1 ribonuclease P protein component [Aequorivita sublithincola DSM 14238]
MIRDESEWRAINRAPTTYMNQKFPKTQKLKSSKTIENLFLEAKTYSKFPIKIFFLPKENLETNLAAFAVPKRNFKSAVDRNRIKRQLREAYRLNKHILEENHGKKFVMLFLYLGKVKPQYAELEKAMVKLLKKLYDEMSQDKS